jgi:sigma-B regulation protein RsbU (phosphoserine phosphatase)
VERAGTETGSLLGYGDFPRAVTDLGIALAPGDALVLYTDGVTEAVDGKAGREMFGDGRLKEVIKALPPEERTEQWAARIYSAIDQFGQSKPLADDLTLVILRRT